MPTTLPILEYTNAVFRYRLVAVCTLLVGLLLTGTVVYSLPNMYQSTTLIMVEPQNVPEAYVKATVTQLLEKRLQAMNQEVLSRTRLEGIIKDLDLYKELRVSGMPMESIVDTMRRKVKVQVYPSDNAFRISYEGMAPPVVQQVTARLAALYIDENLRIREEHASGTTEFLEAELEKVRKQLGEQETKIQTFKQRYMGELPEQRDANMHALEGYRQQLQTTSSALSATMERKLILDRQVADAQAFRPPLPGPGGAPGAALSPAARLRQLETELSDLRSRYTDNHPDVTQTLNQINRLRAELRAGRGDGVTAGPVAPELAQAVAQTAGEVRRLQEEEARLKQAIEAYQQRVENAFVREQELKEITRDYDVTRDKYQRLLDKKLEAQLSQSLERRQKAERFRVLDPASRPQAPLKPNRPVLLAAGSALSLALAIAIPILLWQLDSSYRSAEELVGTGITVLAAIPQVETPEVRQRRRVYRLTVVAASVAALAIGLATQILYAKFLY